MSQKPRIGRWAIRLVLIVAMIGAGWCYRATIATGVCRVLIVDQHPAYFQNVLLLSHGDNRFNVAAGLYDKDPSRRILLISPFPTCLVREGIVPEQSQWYRYQLQTRDVPPEAVETLPGISCSPWDDARLLRKWLDDHPDDLVLVLSDRFSSRAVRTVYDDVLSAEQKRRVYVRALPDRRHDETNWWKVRSGAKQFMFAWLNLSCLWLGGETPPIRGQWNPEAFERELRERWRGKMRY